MVNLNNVRGGANNRYNSTKARFTNAMDDASIGDLDGLVSIGKDIADGIDQGLDAVGRVKGAITNNSLTQATRPFTIRSRAFVEDTIARLDVTSDILRTSCSMYTGMIMIALQMQNMVASGTSVGDLMNSVSSEAVNTYIDAEADFEADIASLEDDSARRRASERAERQFDRAERMRREDQRDKERREERAEKREREDRRDEERREKERRSTLDPYDDESVQHYIDKSDMTREIDGKISDKYDTIDNKVGARDVTIDPTDILPQGKLMDVNLVGIDRNGNQISQHVTIAVAMSPFLITDEAAALILGHSTTPPKELRKIQYKAGELRYVKDLIFQADRIEKMRKALANDRSGGYGTFLNETVKKDKSKIRQIFTALRHKDPNRISKNVANSVLVVTEDAVRRAKMESGFDLHSAGQRAGFFSNTYVMMIWVVDQSFERVTLYLNGVDDVGQYSYSQLSIKKSGPDSTNFVQLLSTLTQNRAPRF